MDTDPRSHTKTSLAKLPAKLSPKKIFQRLIKKVVPKEKMATENDSEEEIIPYLAELLKEITNFSKIKIEDIMIPRSDIVAVNEQINCEELIDKFNENHFYCMIVYGENLDNIVGFVNLKDILPCIKQANAKFQLSKFLKPLTLVTPTGSALELMLKMYEHNYQIALVIDEYGGVDGLVTLKTIQQKLFSYLNKRKRHDSEIQKFGENYFQANARIELDKLENKIGRKLKEGEFENCETLGGLLSVMEGRVPPTGTILKHPAGIEFIVLEANIRNVKKVAIRLA